MTPNSAEIEREETIQQLNQEEQQLDQPKQQEAVDQKPVVVPPPISTLDSASPSTSPPISPSQPQQPQQFQPQQKRFSGYLIDNVWYEVFRQHYNLGEPLNSCLLVNTQFFRNAIPFFWRDVEIIYFSQLNSFVRTLGSSNQTLPYARYIRTIHITARTPRAPNKSCSAELASLLYKLASIDVNWRLLSFILELDWKDCEESTSWTNFFAKIGKHLEHVVLRGSSPFLGDALSFSVGEFCPNLKTLTLESRYFNGYGIVNVAEKCSLTELNIWCRQVTSSVVLSIFQGRSTQTLQKLTIKNCDLDDKPLLNSEGYNNDISNTSDNENVIRSSSKDNSSKISILPKLKSFSLIQSYPFKTGNKLTSSGLLKLLSTCPNLTELTLVVSDSSTIVNDSSIEQIVKRFPLDSLEIVNPYSNQLPFHHLDHFDVTVEGLKKAIEHKPDLRLRVGAFDSMIV